MGWIISTCILATLFFLALLAVCILYFIADRRIRELQDDWFDERRNRNAIVDKANRIIGERNRIIEEQVATLDRALDIGIAKIDEANRTIAEANRIIEEKNRTIDKLKAKLERTNEIIDRLSNSNMNAPQPIMEPQVIQRIA